MLQAALSQAAIQENERSKKGRFVNHNQLPRAVWADLMPRHYGVKLAESEVERMEEIGHHYSKSRGRVDDANYHSDSAEKQKQASAEVRMAAETFAEDTYKQLEELSRLK